MKLFPGLVFALGVSAAPLWHGAAAVDEGVQLEKRAADAADPTLTRREPASGCKNGAPQSTATSHQGPNGSSASSSSNYCTHSGPVSGASEAQSSKAQDGQESGTSAGSSAAITNPNAVNPQVHTHAKTFTHVIQTPDGPVIVSHSTTESNAHDDSGDSAESGAESTSIQGKDGSYTEQGSHEESTGQATATATATAIATTYPTAAPTPTP